MNDSKDLTHMAKPGGLTVVAGGAGFIGSHLCRALADRGHEVLCLDSLQTARVSNRRLIESLPGVTFLRHDIVDPLPPAVTDRAADITRVYNLACAASPPSSEAWAGSASAALRCAPNTKPTPTTQKNSSITITPARLP